MKVTTRYRDITALVRTDDHRRGCDSLEVHDDSHVVVAETFDIATRSADLPTKAGVLNGTLHVGPDHLRD